MNFELPNVPEDYVHRIGRTGRAGAAGSAVSLVDSSEIKYLKAIERIIKKQIPQLPAPTGWTASPVTTHDADDDARSEGRRDGPRRPQQRSSRPAGPAGSGAPRPARAGQGTGQAPRREGQGSGRAPSGHAPARSGTGGPVRTGSGPNGPSQANRPRRPALFNK